MNDKVLNYVKNQLATNSAWAQRAVLKVYEMQTADEKSSGHTHYLNGFGFNGTDGPILSSFAEQILKGRNMSAKQMALIYKKMPKYAKQVVSMIDPIKLESLEKKVLVEVSN